MARAHIKCMNVNDSKEAEEVAKDVISLFSQTEIEKFNGPQKVILIANLTPIQF